MSERDDLVEQAYHAPLTHTGDERCPICYAPQWSTPGRPLPAILCYGPDARPVGRP